MSKTLIAIFLLFSSFLDSIAQIGTPQIINYNRDEYKGGLQNWDVAQDKSGRMYFGNNEGLLAFNGQFWDRYRLPNLTSVRSVEIDEENRIFVGGQDEIGYFFPDKRGLLQYHSLTSLIPQKYRKFADVWNVCISEKQVFFRAFNVILLYKDGIIKTYKAEVGWDFVGKGIGLVFAQSRGRGLKVYDQGIWKQYCDDPVLRSSAVTSIVEYHKDTLLVSTLKSGLFLLHKGELFPKKTGLDATFYNDRVYFVQKLDKDRFVVGTTSGGIFIINKSGVSLQEYKYKDGLQSSNVRACYTDKDKNLWLALDDGIDFIAINSPVTTVFPDKTKQTTSYAIRVFGDKLYIGTANGLYAANVDSKIADLSDSKGSFKEVKHTKGQVWNLNELNNQLLMGHEDGFFTIDNYEARKVNAMPGTWLFEPVSDVFPSNEIIAGTYLGLQHIKFENGKFYDKGKVTGIAESLRFIVFDGENHLWASHPYHGVFKIELSADKRSVSKYSLFTKQDGLPSHLYNYVFKVKNRIVVATENGVYEYDALKNRFIQFQLINQTLKGMSIQYLKEDPNGNLWFVSNKRVGVLDFMRPAGGKPYSLNYLSQLDGKVVGGFESIYYLNDENVFIGANNGAYHINYAKYLANISRPDMLIGSVKLFGKKDSLIFGGYFVKDSKIIDKQDVTTLMELAHEFNSMHFEYASTSFEFQKNIQYSYQLEGFDKKWSPWGQKTEKDYTNLSAGSYIFKVKSRNNLGNESLAASYAFRILPPWYQTIWMYMFYMMCTFMILYLVFKWQKKKHLKAQERLSYLHQLEMDRTEQEIVRLKYEKLEADVNYKNRELSTMTMHLVQRGKVLAKIKEVISTVLKNHDINDSSPSFRHLIRLIRDVEKSDEDWDNFTMHFTNVNANFFNELKDKFSDLTPNELKLSAYLKMNLSTKEIAQLMNITIKAVEVGRYRLRKKLHLQPEINLFEFLNAISRLAEGRQIK
ncbi:ligand-binding sensor domain-containing protein [Pedobacter psychroterrae]|uniref:Transcriptional regulator n=1 Tax=Pedobacter psychroterrae TaxID=2530453 RepID=A0A4R0NI97_9SPHI|nr:triple tyrosine motif-containing protein [Pedobacter psychroterrae]TCD00342.1 transcriptional regulator [Pedobacter psychroterrae]